MYLKGKAERERERDFDLLAHSLIGHNSQGWNGPHLWARSFLWVSSVGAGKLDWKWGSQDWNRLLNVMLALQVAVLRATPQYLHLFILSLFFFLIILMFTNTF